MESIEKNISEEPVEPGVHNISNEEEKGSGKGKLPENQLTTTPAVSFQKAIVDSTSTRTPTISKILQYCDNTSEKDESQEINNEKQEEISDQQNLLNDSSKSDSEKDTKWEQNLQDDELLVVVMSVNSK